MLRVAYTRFLLFLNKLIIMVLIPRFEIEIDIGKLPKELIYRSNFELRCHDLCCFLMPIKIGCMLVD